MGFTFFSNARRPQWGSEPRRPLCRRRGGLQTVPPASTARTARCPRHRKAYRCRSLWWKRQRRSNRIDVDGNRTISTSTSSSFFFFFAAPPALPAAPNVVLRPGPATRGDALLLLLRHGRKVLDMAPLFLFFNFFGGRPAALGWGRLSPAAAAPAAATAILYQQQQCSSSCCSCCCCFRALRALRRPPSRRLLQDGPERARVLPGRRRRSSCSSLSTAAAAFCSSSSSAAAAATKLPAAHPQASVARFSDGRREGRGAGREERRAREGSGEGRSGGGGRRRRKGDRGLSRGGDGSCNDRSDGPILLLRRAPRGLVSRARQGVREGESCKQLGKALLFWVGREETGVFVVVVVVISRSSKLSSKFDFFLFQGCRTPPFPASLSRPSVDRCKGPSLSAFSAAVKLTTTGTS